MARFIKIAMRLRLVDDLKMLKITFYHTNQDKGTSSSLKSNITTSYSQDKKKKEVCKHKNEDLHNMIGSTIPTDPHHTPTFIQPSPQPQMIQQPRKPKRKDTQVPHPSDPIKNVTDEAVHKELGDSLVRAATTASSLEAEQDSGNINKTQSKVTPNESSSLGTTSCGGPKSQETIRDTIAQTRFENVSKHSNDSARKRVLDLEKTKTTQQNEIASLKRRVKKLEKKNEEMFDVNVLDGEEVFVAEQEVVNAGNVVSTASDATTVSAATTTTATITTVDDITLAQSLMEIKVQNPRRKGLLYKTWPMNKKDLTRIDEETALKLQAEFDEEERLAREKAKKVEEANIALIETWDDIQAKIDADFQLDERMQAQEQEELSIEEKATLFQQLLKERRKHFAAKRA
ncbi:hypothetical protein Tco_1202766 [Tanacetum coccineum]